MTRTMNSKKTLAALVIALSAFALGAAAQDKPKATPQDKGLAQAKAQDMPDDMEHGHSPKAGPLVVAKGPCKKIGPTFETGMKLYLMTDHRLIGEVTGYRPSHLFADGKSREAVRLKLADGKSTWLPADTARRIYVTQ
jgi:hypothetical protein